MRDNGEAKLQVAFISWAHVALPDVLVWHTYNENSVSAIQGKIKKDRGVLAGVHDNCLAWAGGNFATIELKSPSKSPTQSKYSATQKIFAERLDSFGFKHFCCQNGDEIEAAIKLLGLAPKYRFPPVLEKTKRLMMYQAAPDIMYS